MINNYFDHVFCINLERRTDRLEQVTAEFKKFGITAEFIRGVDGLTLDIPEMISSDGQKVSRGDIGCTRTHCNIAKMAKERGITKYITFEDDVLFHEQFNEWLPGFMAQVPADFDFLYLGGNHMGGFTMCPGKNNLAHISKTFTTHAYAVNGTDVIDAIIEVLGRDDEKVDIGVSSLHSKFNSFTFRPSLAYQRESYSDILEKSCNYAHLKE